ncbi:unnamed protein product [Amoebophrya sp. A25]|nr:unnamed protein product [Amoebophrya sp. A25]|eukprot:GSA25T00023984001.1
MKTTSAEYSSRSAPAKEVTPSSPSSSLVEPLLLVEIRNREQDEVDKGLVISPCSSSRGSVRRPLPPVTIDWKPTTGLRGLCALQIMIGHFFFGAAPRSLRAVCNDPGIGDDAYTVLIAMDQPVALFFLLSGLLYGVLYYDKFDFVQDEEDDVEATSSSSSSSSTPTTTERKMQSIGKQGYQKWTTFVKKRFVRLTPAWYAALLFMMPFYLPDRNLPTETKVEGTVTAFTYLQSVLGPPDGFPHVVPPPHGPGWQISAFMLSYLFLPFVFFLVRRSTWSLLGAASSVKDAKEGVRDKRLQQHQNMGGDTGLLMGVVFSYILSIVLMRHFAATVSIGITHSFFVVRFPNVVMGIFLGMLMKRRTMVNTIGASTDEESYCFTHVLPTLNSWMVSACCKVQQLYRVALERIESYRSTSGADELQDDSRTSSCYDAILTSTLDYRRRSETSTPASTSNTTSTTTTSCSHLFLDVTLAVYCFYNVIIVPVFRFDGDIYLQFYLLPLYCVWLWHLVLVDEEDSSTSIARDVVLTHSVPQQLGDWSYALYCLHWPAYYCFTWMLTPGTEYVWHRCLGLSQGNGCFGMQYYHLPFALGFTIILGKGFSEHCEKPLGNYLEKKIV